MEEGTRNQQRYHQVLMLFGADGGGHQHQRVVFKRWMEDMAVLGEGASSRIGGWILLYAIGSARGDGQEAGYQRRALAELTAQGGLRKNSLGEFIGELRRRMKRTLRHVEPAARLSHKERSGGHGRQGH